MTRSKSAFTTLAFIFVTLAGHLASAEDIALFVYAYEPGEFAPRSFASAEKKFARAFAKNPSMKPVSLEAATASQFKESWAASGINAEDRITRLYIGGHGSQCNVGFFSLMTSSSEDVSQLLSAHLAEGAHVYVEACNFLAVEPGVARVIAQIFAQQNGLRSGVLHAFFGTPNFINRIPFWKLKSRKEQLDTLAAYVLPPLAAGFSWWISSITESVVSITVFGGVSAINGVVFWVKHRRGLAANAAYRLTLEDYLVIDHQTTNLKTIREEMFGPCEHSLVIDDQRN